jgi:tRNA pseudouridine55 synthase
VTPEGVLVPEGVLILDKPAGPTSHDLVARARRLMGQRRVGHAGTLDPPACGVLVLVLGRATRLVRFLDHEPKRYTGSFRLGLTTTTDDAQGAVISAWEAPLPDPDAVRAAARASLGTRLQHPPTVSARKVGGHRMYRLARRGIAVEAPPSPVTVFSFSVLAGEAPSEWGFDTVVSGGTYVRSLVRDLGAALGCGACVSTLRRESAGAFHASAAAAVTGDDATDARNWAAAVIPLRVLPLALPGLGLEDPRLARRFRAGTAIPWAGDGDGEVAVRDGDGELLGIGLVRQAALQPRVILAEPRRLW